MTAKKKSHDIYQRATAIAENICDRLPFQLTWNSWTTGSTSTSNSASAVSVIKNISAESENVVIALDWTYASRLSDEIPAYANARNYTSVVLPHGDSPFRNPIRRTKSFNRLINDADFNNPENLFSIAFSTWKDKAKYDYILMPNELTARRINTFADEEQIKIFDSLRYNLEWLDILAETSTGPSPEASAELKLVFFTRQARYFVSEQAVRDTVRLVTNFPNTHLIIKEHPRGKILGRDTDLHNVENCDIVRDEMESAALTDWGDAFLSLGTTITFEPIMRNKPVLAIEYAHGNYTTVASYFSSANIQCRDDLYRAMYSLRNSNNNFYGLKQHRRFVEEMVTAGNESVLETYAKFIESRLKLGN